MWNVPASLLQSCRTCTLPLAASLGLTLAQICAKVPAALPLVLNRLILHLLSRRRDEGGPPAIRQAPPADSGPERICGYWLVTDRFDDDTSILAQGRSDSPIMVIGRPNADEQHGKPSQLSGKKR
jgi:hypothetical protein